MGKQRVQRTRAGNTWTEARYWQFIRSALRQAYSRYPAKFQAKKAVERLVTGKRHKYEYKCAECNDWFQGKETQVDHIVGAGSLSSYDDLPGFAERLFCEAEGMQVLCKPCHQLKTNAERKERKR
jgi:5-methylcytosine-specific restriction endonuclease McrA